MTHRFHIPMSLLGIHHLTAVCSDARRTVDFYTRVLGLMLVKKTVNFDDPGAYHLYFGDEIGKPGSILTFFEWSHLPRGMWGIGTTHHLAFTVETPEAQRKWKRWLMDRGLIVTGPYDRTYFRSIYFTDPDGLILEIATRGPGWTVDEEPGELGTGVIEPDKNVLKGARDEEAILRDVWPGDIVAITPDMRITHLHHVTAMCSDIAATTGFFTQVLGMIILKKTVNYDDPNTPHYYFGVGEGKPGTIMTYFGYPAGAMRTGRIGTGMTHHIAFAVENDEAQLHWRIRLMKAGVPVTSVMDRTYFKSIYFSDPDGHILEIATLGPGFLIDEERESLGRALKLPRWLESERTEIEQSLSPLV